MQYDPYDPPSSPPMSRGVTPLRIDTPDEERGLTLSHQEIVETTQLSPSRGTNDYHDLQSPRSRHPHLDGMLGRARTLRKRQKIAWDRFNGAGRRKIGIMESINNMVMSSYINILVITIPLAWMSHFFRWYSSITFSLCFLAMMPLEKTFEWGGSQLALYCGQHMGDLIIVTLNNVVEATLSIILLSRCELKLLQSTVAGVILLHLLLVPGTAFLTGGSKIWEQQLHPHTTQLNQALLILGVMMLVMPAAFFSALDHGLDPLSTQSQKLVNNKVRGQFLQISRGTSFLFLNIYLLSRVYLHNPPGRNNSILTHPDAPEAMKKNEFLLEQKEPETNPWVCLFVLGITVALVAVTADFLVESIAFIRVGGTVGDEWFGMILLPIVSFGADGAVAIVYFMRKLLDTFLWDTHADPPSELAKARAIDMSIQFILFWLPMFILIAWWTGKPLSMLFDMYAVAALVASALMVNYITQDSKTNWVEGAMMILFYVTIAMWTWFYPGQTELAAMLACAEGVPEAIGMLQNGTAVG